MLHSCRWRAREFWLREPEQHKIHLGHVQHSLTEGLLGGRGLVVEFILRHRASESGEHRVVAGPIIFDFAGQIRAGAHETGWRGGRRRLGGAPSGCYQQ